MFDGTGALQGQQVMANGSCFDLESRVEKLNGSFRDDLSLYFGGTSSSLLQCCLILQTLPLMFS